MRYSILTLPVLAAASVIPRDLSSINTAFGYVNGNITKVNGTVTKLGDKDTINGAAILLQTGDLQKSVDNLADVVDASPALDDTDSGALAVTVTNLQPNIFSLLDNIVSKKPQFETALLGGDASGLVKSNLEKSKDGADALGTAITAKLSDTYKDAAPIVIGQIDDKFDEAIAAFSD